MLDYDGRSCTGMRYNAGAECIVKFDRVKICPNIDCSNKMLFYFLESSN